MVRPALGHGGLCGECKPTPLPAATQATTCTGREPVLQTYTDKLRAAKPEMKPKDCLAAVLLAVGLAGAAGALIA